MHSSARIAVWLPVIGVLAAGCAANPDPAQAGFFSGLGNLASGTYKDREAAQAARLDAETAQTEALQRQTSQVKARQEAADVEAAALRRRLSKLDGELKGMRRDIDAARVAGTTDQRRLQAVRMQLDALQASSAELADRHGEGLKMEQAIAEAEARRTRLRAVMDDALAAARPKPRSTTVPGS